MVHQFLSLFLLGLQARSAALSFAGEWKMRFEAAAFCDALGKPVMVG